MNRYGRLAEQHMRTYLPGRYRHLEDPESYFAGLGEEIAGQVQALEITLAGVEPAASGYLARAGQLRAARMAAEEIVFSDLIWLPDETDQDDPGGETDETGAYIGWADPNRQAIWAPTPEPDEERVMTEYPSRQNPSRHNPSCQNPTLV